MSEAHSMTEAEPAGSRPGPSQPSRPKQIGIWCLAEQDGRNGCVRSEAPNLRAQLTRWADSPTIPPKSRRWRVVLLGESVARGYFFDPDFTPAMVLQAMLEPHVPGVEVIDLAASDLTADELAQLLEQVPALEPDALVLFGGNNWMGNALSWFIADPARRAEVTAALRREGVLGLKRLVETEFEKLVAERVAALPVLSARMGIPVVFLIPDTNLLDWRSCAGSVAPFLAGEGNREWWRLKLEAELAVGSGDLELAIRAARSMVALDGETSPVGMELLGRALCEAGEHAKARGYLERARDARIWEAQPFVPRCGAMVQRVLRRLGGSAVRVVDLPKVFRGQSRLPDRTLFMDYCHLSAFGIRIAMAEAAAALLKDTGVPRETLAASAASTPAPTPAVEGAAHVLAAIHNAHLGQEPSLLRHHLDRAKELSARSLEILRTCSEMLGRACPPVMSSAAAACFEAPEANVRKYLLRYHGVLFLNEVLLREMGDCLRSVPKDRGAQAEPPTEDWKVTPQQPVDLLSLPYRRHLRERSWPSKSRAWYQAYLPSSRFPLILEEKCALLLTITSRSARFFRPDAGLARVRLNGTVVAELSLESDWRTERVSIAAGHSRPGLNELTLEWPMGSWASAQAIEWAAEQLEADRIVDLTAAFADVCTLSVRTDAA